MLFCCCVTRLLDCTWYASPVDLTSVRSTESIEGPFADGSSESSALHHGMSRSGLNVNAAAWCSKFVPAVPEAHGPPGRGNEPCIFFTMGGCQKGELCPYSHSFLRNDHNGGPADLHGGFVLHGRVANADLAGGVKQAEESSAVIDLGYDGGKSIEGFVSSTDGEDSPFASPVSHEHVPRSSAGTNPRAAPWHPSVHPSFTPASGATPLPIVVPVHFTAANPSVIVQTPPTVAAQPLQYFIVQPAPQLSLGVPLMCPQSQPQMIYIAEPQNRHAEMF